jgi:predicted RNA methylase
MDEIIKRLATLENITPLLALPSILRFEPERTPLGDGDTLEIAEGAESNVRLVHAAGREQPACLLFRTRDQTVRSVTTSQVEGVWLGQPVPEEFALVLGLVGFSSGKVAESIGSIEEEALHDRCRTIDSAWCLLRRLQEHADTKAHAWDRHRLAAFNGINTYTATAREAKLREMAKDLVVTVAGLESIELEEEVRGASIAMVFRGKSHETFLPGAPINWRPGTVNFTALAAAKATAKRAKAVSPDRYSVKPSRVPSEVLDVLAGLLYDGTAVRINERLSPKLYSKVNYWLTEMGGRWHTGQQAHVFECDPKGPLSDVLQTGTCFTASDYEFFATQRPEVERVMRLARLEQGMQVLEPSAGQGSLALAAADTVGIENVHCMELMPANVKALQALGFKLQAPTDFLAQTPVRRYHRAVLNPPFGGGRDIAHIEHAMKWIVPGGRLVAIASTTWQTQDIARAVAFRAMLDRLGATVEEIPAGAFKAAGTDVPTTLLAFDIPDDEELEHNATVAVATEPEAEGQLAFF